MDEHRMGMGTGAGTETRAVAEMGKLSVDGNPCEHRIGEGRGEAKKRKRPLKSCRRHVGNGKYLGGKKEKRRKERVGPGAANPNDLRNNKEAGEGAKVPRA